MRECNFPSLDFCYVSCVRVCVRVCFSPNFYLFPSVNKRIRRTFFPLYLLSFQLCRQSSFELFSLSVFVMHVTQKRCTSNDTKIRFTFYFENGKNRYTIYIHIVCIVFNKFLSLQIQMDRLELAKPKMYECAVCAPCSFGMLWTKQKEKYCLRVYHQQTLLHFL